MLLYYSTYEATKCPEANDMVCSCSNSKTCICEEVLPPEGCTGAEPYSAAVCDANSCKSVTGKQVLPSQCYLSSTHYDGVYTVDIVKHTWQ